MRILAVLIALLLPALACAQTWEDRQVFGAADATTTLRILSSTDTSFFAPIVAGFVADRPSVAVEYLVTGTADLDAVFRAAPGDFDIVISSAMDLQLKLANDGFAARLPNVAHPDWAQWRGSLFAFTTEPAAIVLNTEAFTRRPVPTTRQALIQTLRDAPEVFAGKVGTYDVRTSGLGYLFATQDARASETFWRLMEVMGSLDAQLYCCSGEMIADLSAGRILVAYNVLGSYALSLAETDPSLTVVLPSDFPTTMMRSALVSRTTARPDLARDFVSHLIALQANGAPEAFPLPPLDSFRGSTGQASIALDPALMTYLDALKRRTFLRAWEDAIIQD